MAPVVVGSSDVTVDLNASSVPSVSGTITTENGVPIPRGMTVWVRHITSLRTTTSTVGEDGSFTIAGIVPGRYQILVGGAKDVYPKTVGIGDKEMRVFDVTDSGVNNVKIVAGFGGGNINGTVMRGGTPTYGVLAVLAPEELTDEHDRYHGFQSDSDGSFAWTNLRPGNYRLFALPSCDFEYATPEKLRPYMSLGKQIRIGPGDTFREKVEVIE
jgi:hypothetical protein